MSPIALTVTIFAVMLVLMALLSLMVKLVL